ncbi:MAG: hypothetical protein IJE53_07200 [Bacilli bacterium]|nr:hypothetical protein [Bacilli bacterium]
MQQIENLELLKKIIAFGMTILVLGSLATTYIISKCNIIKRKKDQSISLIYKVDYQTS